MRNMLFCILVALATLACVLACAACSTGPTAGTPAAAQDNPVAVLANIETVTNAVLCGGVKIQPVAEAITDVGLTAAGAGGTVVAVNMGWGIVHAAAQAYAVAHGCVLTPVPAGSSAPTVTVPITATPVTP